ncbi:hypothetical protein Hypma_014104 [Hypsizygus marmoreus]|uniref:Uncharacterized protein n=1 Tax=Hypsizygus marmoreus TaxID=39966 RepID=A0A369K8R6_HYPMA|nr:hypothetical protein Hypma_014104 [Hypsizygus marmoreus]
MYDIHQLRAWHLRDIWSPSVEHLKTAGLMAPSLPSPSSNMRRPSSSTLMAIEFHTNTVGHRDGQRQRYSADEGHSSTNVISAVQTWSVM